jgi:hypothetical protein
VGHEGALWKVEEGEYFRRVEGFLGASTQRVRAVCIDVLAYEPLRRARGMAVPLQSDQELGEGPNVLVRERPQLWKRLRAWQTVLANSPGAPMTAVLPAVHSAERTDIVTWDIGGDAAKDGEPKQGLGAWFYGVWWCAPLGDWPALADAHITCLELVEVGLGVVMTARWLAEAKRIRLRADAAAAFLTLRARRDDGSLARGARAAELVTAHEVLMQQPEWKQLHDGRREILTEHTFGESMLLHDAASRNNPELIRDVSAALGIVPKQIELSARARAYLQDVSNALLDSRRGAAPCMRYQLPPVGRTRSERAPCRLR